MTDKLLGALGLARRAGALQLGFDAAFDAVQSGCAHLVLFAADVSPKNMQRISAACQNSGVPTKVLCHTKQALSQITVKPVAILAVTNKDFAALCDKTTGKLNNTQQQAVILAEGEDNHINHR